MSCRISEKSDSSIAREKGVRRIVLRLIACIAAPLLWLAADGTAQSSFELRSPGGRVLLKVRAGDRLSYDVLFDGKTLLQNCTLAITINEATFGLRPLVRASSRRAEDRQLEPAVRQKSATVRERYNELRLDLQGDYSVVFRAYDEGAAYRLETALPQAEVKVDREEVNLNFVADFPVYYPEEESFFSHNERQFSLRSLAKIPSGAIASVPVVVDADGVKIAVADSDVEDYPGLWLRGTNGNALSGVFPPYPLKEKLDRDRDLRVTEAAGYIAVTRGTRTYPWRILGIAANDGDLITNRLVYLLAGPSRVQDTSWIKAGKVAWDWWNANNIYGVDFKSGINTRTYKYYIDFASRHGIEYVVLDEGWYKLGNVLDVVPAIDISELTEYARQKNVGIVLWVIWKTLDDQLVPALDQFEKWGVKGIKVDFMQRDDQKVVNFYHRVCREAARRKMLVDFHGAIRSATMTRTWPNLISNEGVKGLEWCKWSADVDPEHDVTIPFTRMFLGPMDFTPGAMVNASKRDFAPIFERPMSLGTRCHQLAMYVVYESPLQMLADSPSNYLRQAETMEFLGPVPTVWDETRVLDAKLGDYVLLARRKGPDWYVGAMTDWTGRKLQVAFSFLPAGTFQLEAYEDGINAERRGEDYRKVRSRVTSETRLEITLAGGGGWVARIRP